MTGNLLVGQSGGPTAVINASLAGVVREARQSASIRHTIGMRFGIEGFLEDLTVDLDALAPADLDLLCTTPSSALGSCRYKLKDLDLPRILGLLERHDVRYLSYIGGNDTMDTVHRIEQYCSDSGYDICASGVPKTVDNDLHATDHTPGYPSAARYVASSVQQAGRLARDMQRVDPFTIFQTIGRDAGWLAAASSLARSNPGDPPHLIYLPERPITRDQVLDEVGSAVRINGWCSIVVGEGTRWTTGEPVSQSQTSDVFANVEYGAMAGTSAAMVLHGLISSATGLRGEFQVTESLPMVASDRVVPLDRIEAEACGAQAVSRMARGESGFMVTIERAGERSEYAATYGTAPLSEVAIRAKPLPDDFIGDSDVTEKFTAYAAPLIGDLPRMFTFQEET